MNKILNWLRKKILQFLRLDYDIYLSCDIGYKNSALIVIKHNQRDNTFNVIGDYYSQNKCYRELIYEISKLCHKYKIPADKITIDASPDFLDAFRNFSWRKKKEI